MYVFVGEIVLVSMAADGPVEAWQAFPEGRDTTPASSFTQQDVNEGTVWYRHYGRGTQRDTFQFQVTNTHKHTQLFLCYVGSKCLILSLKSRICALSLIVVFFAKDHSGYLDLTVTR